jgi:predicted outer membrane repeat protein
VASFGAKLTVQACGFYNNSATKLGAGGGAVGVFGANTTAVISNSLFKNNSAFGGGAINVQNGATVQLDNNAFDSNTAVFAAGSVYADSNSTLQATSCTFTSDTASNGGSVLLGTGTQSSLTNCTFDSSSVSSAVNGQGVGGAIEIINATSATFTQVSYCYATQYSVLCACTWLCTYTHTCTTLNRSHTSMCCIALLMLLYKQVCSFPILKTFSPLICIVRVYTITMNSVYAV